MIGYPIVRLAKLKRDQAEAREATWLAAVEAGMSQKDLAQEIGIHPGQLSRRLARARAARLAPASGEIRRLELTGTAMVTAGCGPTTMPTSDEPVLYSLPDSPTDPDGDRISLDGGRSWLANQSSQTPSVTVLAPDGTGRGSRARTLTSGSTTEPGGPTSYHPNQKLQGGRGRSRRRGSSSSPGVS